MNSLSALLFASALAGGQAAPAPQQPQTEQASLYFVAKGQILVGTLYGIDSIDASQSVFGKRTIAKVLAGRRTVWYSCPNAPQMAGGSRLTFNFVAGHQYELVCEPGKEAAIRQSDEC